MKTKNSLFSTLALVGALVLTLGGNLPAYAQDNGTSIKISPVLFDELTANPGEQLSSEITVSNPGSSAIVLYPEAQNFLPEESNEEGVPKNTTADTPYAIKDWVTFSVTQVELAPGQQEKINFRIDVPTNATPGGHYGSLIFTTKAPEGAPESTTLKVESGVAALVLLRVNGDIVESATVKEFSNTGVTGGPDARRVDFVLRLENTGNTHVKPTGTIKITNWLGSQVDEIELQGENTLPSSIRKMVTSWPTDGRTLYGKYTATLEATYGESNQKITATTTFGDYHFTTILIIVIIILLIILFIKMSSKSYKEELSKEIKEEMKE